MDPDVLKRFGDLETRLVTLERPQPDRKPHWYTVCYYVAMGVIAFAAVWVSVLSGYASWQAYHISGDNLAIAQAAFQTSKETRVRDENRTKQIKLLEIADHFIDRFYQIERDEKH